MSIESQMQAVAEELNTAIADANKFDRGNSAAGTRVRKAAMSVTKALKSIRTEVQNIKNT